MEEVSLYIHIPYCRSKCGYCDFNSFPGREAEYENYAQALLAELEFRGSELEHAAVPSIFFGGGTPTILRGELLSSILARCVKAFNIAPEAEISVEANPETVSPELFDALLAVGFNRLSLGVQSFDDESLRRLGRIHDGDSAVKGIRLAAEAGFKNVSLDLMFGLPAQEVSQWDRDLETALSHAPQHISAYGLKIEEKTPFDRLRKMGIITLPDEEACSDMYSLAVEKLTAEGYEHYEISNFAKPGFRCRHNVNYWRNGQYLGLGAGAHSYLKGERSANIKAPGDYMTKMAEGGSALEFRERLSPRAALGEALMLGLRLTEGIDVEDYGNKYGIDFNREYGSTVKELCEEGLLEMEGRCLRLSRSGILLSDEVFIRLV